MNKLPFFTLALSSLIAAVVHASPAVDSSTLFFSNGDTISGKWLNFQDDQISIDSPHFRESITQFDSSSLLEVHLPEVDRTQLAAPSANHVATLTLEDRFGFSDERDEIKGNILEISEEFVTLSTTFAGTLQVDKTLIHSITSAPTHQVIYEGPNSLEEWNPLTDSNRAWTFKNKSFTSSDASGSISNDLKLPEKSLLTFDIKWKDIPRLTVFLYAENSQNNHPRNLYSLKINHGRVTMMRHSDSGPFSNLQPLGSTRPPAILASTASLAIYMDKRKGLFHVFCNNEHIATFKDSPPFPTKLGTSVHFRNDQNQKFQIKNIRVTQWLGKPPAFKDQAESAETLTGEGELLHLANGDTMRGILGDVKEGLISVKTTHGTFQVPLAGISVLMQRSQLKNQARADRNDVKAHFHDGGWLIIDVDKIDSTHIFGNNEAIGDCKFRLDAFEKIEFNIYNRALSAIRKERSW